MYLLIFYVLNTVLYIISNIFDYIFVEPRFDKKGVKEIKSHLFKVTLDNFLVFINSPGER